MRATWDSEEGPEPGPEVMTFYWIPIWEHEQISLWKTRLNKRRQWSKLSVSDVPKGLLDLCILSWTISDTAPLLCFRSQKKLIKFQQLLLNHVESIEPLSSWINWAPHQARPRPSPEREETTESLLSNSLLGALWVQRKLIPKQSIWTCARCMMMLFISNICCSNKSSWENRLNQSQCFMLYGRGQPVSARRKTWGWMVPFCFEASNVGRFKNENDERFSMFLDKWSPNFTQDISL